MLLDQLGSGPYLVGRLMSVIWVSASFQTFLYPHFTRSNIHTSALYPRLNLVAKEAFSNYDNANANVGLFIPLHFRSRKRKVHRWNFRSVEHSLLGTFAPVEQLSFLGSKRSKNFRTFRTNRLFQELSLQASKNNLKLKLYISP